MIVEAYDALDRAGQQLVFGINASGLGEQLDIQPLVLEVAELLGELGRQIDLLLEAADHERNFLCRLRGMDTGYETQNARCLQQQTLADH